MSATPLFMMDIIISVKIKINIPEVSERLNIIATNLGVDVAIKEI